MGECDLLSDAALLTTFRGREDLERIGDARATRYAYERAIAELHREHEAFVLPGHCQPCRQTVGFVCDWRYSYDGMVNFREHLACPRCGLNNRQRFVAHVLPRWGRPPFYLYEQVTPFYAWARARLPDVVGSEYLGHGIASGTTIDGVRHEDALALSFGDASLGTIVSNDVFEHVPDIDAALAECARVLRPDGVLLFSVPFDGAHEQTLRRAELRDGALVELLEPQYHGNPVDPKGSLVFYEHGWDVLDRCNAAGFADAHVVGYWSAFHGYLGGSGLQMLLVASRDGPAPPLLG